MSSNVTSPSKKRDSVGTTSSPSGVKGKAKVNTQEEDGEEDDDDDDDDQVDDDEMESGDDEDDEEENLDEVIDPKVILPPTRRLRGIRVDYTSKEALEKAGLTGKVEADSDDDDEDVKMKD